MKSKISQVIGMQAERFVQELRRRRAEAQDARHTLDMALQEPQDARPRVANYAIDSLDRQKNGIGAYYGLTGANAPSKARKF